QQVRDAGSTKHLEFGQPSAVGVVALHPGGVQFAHVVPDLLPGFLEKSLRAKPVQGCEQPVEASLFGSTSLLLGFDASGKNGVDSLVVTPPPSDQDRIVEVVRTDNGEHGLRQ